MGNASCFCTQDNDFFDALTAKYLARFNVRVISDVDLLQILRDEIDH